MFFGTKQVAELLNIPEWRVKNFSEGEAYGLPPSQKLGSGRGSRRLYDIMDLSRMAIAKHLVDAGFSPEAVGKAVRAIPDSKLRSWQRVIESKSNRAVQMDLLVWERGEWQLMKGDDLQEVFRSRFEDISPTNLSGLFVLNFHRSVAALDLAIEDLSRNETNSLKRGGSRGNFQAR